MEPAFFRMTKVTQLNVGADGGTGRRRIHLREISGDSEAPLETVGQDLRAARLRRGEDLATVSRALKIRKDHLDAVEADDLTRLPGKTYAIGFVRTYAGYLGLDATETVERFKQEISGRHDVHATSAPSMDYDGRRLPHGWRIVAAVVIVVAAYGAWHLLSGEPASQPVPPPPIVSPPHPAATPAPPPQTQAQAQTQPATMNAPEVKLVAPRDPAPADNVAAAATGGSATPSPAVPVKPGHVYGAQNKNPRVVLRALADVHIAVRGSDGRLWINRDLLAGDTYHLPNQVGLTLASSNAGALEVDLDGQAMGRAGLDQETTGGIDLDPQAIVDRGKTR